LQHSLTVHGVSPTVLSQGMLGPETGGSIVVRHEGLVQHVLGMF
jgi:hypothetical protein